MEGLPVILDPPTRAELAAEDLDAQAAAEVDDAERRDVLDCLPSLTVLRAYRFACEHSGEGMDDLAAVCEAELERRGRELGG
jgi:hypothetical protein